ncbi:MAG: hypothetical protein KatS3mg131_2278 [Candidatus Tectimicrobiota bacterium]|nr:MAG: hypothetical protein KatS3mg131_2278 [Candidatus Tectomicrobia bacterium]
MRLWLKRYTYDDRGNPASEEHFRGDGTLVAHWRHTYAYDAWGNWVRRITAAQPAGTATPQEMTYRLLTYYD